MTFCFLALLSFHFILEIQEGCRHRFINRNRHFQSVFLGKHNYVKYIVFNKKVTEDLLSTSILVCICS